MIAAEILLAAALLTRIPYLIKRAWDYLWGCVIAYSEAREAMDDANAKAKEAADKYEECLKSHGADSGSNSSGSNNG